MSTIAPHSPLNISETVRDRGLVPEDHRKWPTKGQTRDTNTLRAQYIENSWICYLATIANYIDCLL